VPEIHLKKENKVSGKEETGEMEKQEMLKMKRNQLQEEAKHHHHQNSVS
jgi:hypothetical protein